MSYKNQDKDFIKLIRVILAMLVISIIMILAIFIVLNKIWNLNKSDYITILSSIIASYITLLGTLGTIWIAYSTFKLQIEHENRINEDIKVYHLFNLYEILKSSIVKSYIFTEYVCVSYDIMILEEDEFENDDKEAVIKKGLFRISQYNKFSHLLERESNKDKYINDILNLKIELDKEAYNYDDVGMHFSIYDRNFIKEWLGIKNVDKFENFTQVYKFLMCRDEIIRILKKWDSKYKQDEYIDKSNHFYRGIGEIYSNVTRLNLENSEFDEEYEDEVAIDDYE